MARKHIVLRSHGFFLVMGAVIATCTFPSLAMSDPIHDHCIREGIEWSFAIDNPTRRFVLGPGRFTDMEFDFLLPVNPPGVPNCFYETSDITRINATLTFGRGPLDVAPPPSIEALVFARVASEGGTIPHPPTPPVALFRNGVTTSLLYPSHVTGIALHVFLPNDTLTISLANLDEREILGFPMTSRFDLLGHHYHLVPEPSTLALFGMGSLVVLWYGWGVTKAR